MANVKSAMRHICFCSDFVYDGSLAVAYFLTPNRQLTRNSSTGAYSAQYVFSLLFVVGKLGLLIGFEGKKAVSTALFGIIRRGNRSDGSPANRPE